MSLTPIVYTVMIQATTREEFISLLEAEAALVFGEEEWHISGQVPVSGPIITPTPPVEEPMGGLEGVEGGMMGTQSEAPSPVLTPKTWNVTLKSGAGPEVVELSAEEKLLQQAGQRMSKGLV